MRPVGVAVGALVLVATLATGSLAYYLVPRNDEPRDPDAIVVLGGAGEERAALGIELADRYAVPLVLSSSAAHFGEELGRDCGVDAICLQPEPETTAGEAETLRRVADTEGWDHITVVTTEFHTSRARYLFRQCLGRSRVSVIGAVSDSRPRTSPGIMTNEGLGVLAAGTFDRPC